MISILFKQLLDVVMLLLWMAVATPRWEDGFFRIGR